MSKVPLPVSLVPMPGSHGIWKKGAVAASAKEKSRCL